MSHVAIKNWPGLSAGMVARIEVFGPFDTEEEARNWAVCKQAEWPNPFWTFATITPAFEHPGLKKRKSVRCPKCAKRTEIKYVEDLACYYDIDAVNSKEKVLIVDSLTDSDNYDETGENGRLLCLACSTEFPLPTVFSIEWT